ncbi:MAG: hypothetical protein HY908_28145 [Myxococcales bacterium]|nr:hypothetical protein [Myxococcales bacterium]
MHAFLLQDWISVRGTSTNATITQPLDGWLDMMRYQDPVFWTEMSQVGTGGGGTMVVAYQTAPMQEDSYFTDITTVAAAAAATPVVTKALLATATTPIARWLRWRVWFATTPTGNWDITFRSWVAANPSGP